MAARLLDAGYRLCVYDLSEEATATGGAWRPARGLPAEVASVADVVLISLPTPTWCGRSLGSNGGTVNGSSVRP